MSHAGDKLRGPLFAARDIRALSTWFVGLCLIGWAIAQAIRKLCPLLDIPIDIYAVHVRWPLSTVRERIPGIHGPWYEWALAAGLLLVFFLFMRSFLRQATGDVLAVIMVGFFFVLCTNLIHGPEYGLVHPQLADGTMPKAQYYHDATQISSAGGFLREFQQRQGELTCHARTHPPGAVLFIYALWKTFGHPAAVSLAIAALSVVLSGVLLYRMLARDFDRHTCGYVTLLYLLIPSVQIYSCATLDAVVTSCFLGFLLCLRHPRPLLGIGGAVAWLFCGSFLTFGACFLLPVMAGFEIITRRSLRRSAAIVLGVSGLYAAVYFLWGFNYLGALRTASALENPQGFRLLAEPLTYLVTRLEDVVTILVFFGPFLLVLLVRGLREIRSAKTCPELLTLTCLGVLTLLGMFLTGAFRTGETARACLFIYPLLIFPVAAYLQHHPGSEKDQRQLLMLVFGQTVAMQTIAGFLW